MNETHMADPSPESGTPEPRLGWWMVPFASAFYVFVTAVLSYPFVWSFRTKLAGSIFDPLQHLWIMRWYKTCLLEGRSPIICPELQYPAGAALGNFSPLHFQAMLYIPLSMFIRDDVLCFNLIWLFGMVTTGLGTFLLTWQAIKDRWCSLFAGMLAMMAAPMLMHGRGHLELITLGCFPLFLFAWIRFVDRPTRGRLAFAAGTYVLVALCAAYYVVFAAFPAALYAAYSFFTNGPKWGWMRSRVGWLTGFAAMVLPCLALVFGSQLWAIAHGFSGERTLPEFNNYGSPPWTFFIPTFMHPLGNIMPANIYAAAGMGLTMGERASYLGVVTLFLMYYAASRKAASDRRGFLWLTLILLVVLAWGGICQVGPARIELPSLWLKKYLPAFKMIRVPGRFNLFVGVIAAVIAASGLKLLLSRMPRRSYQVATFLALMVVTMFDLSTYPFTSDEIPALPPVYHAILKDDPDAAFVEAPQYSSGGSELYTVLGYWQALHRGKTNAGYSGSPNIKQDNLLTWNSPFAATLMSRGDYLNDPSWSTIDVVSGVDYRDYAWAYLHANKFRYLILHNRFVWTKVPPENLERLKALLASAKIYEDADAVVFDREKLAPPTHPVILSTEGWRPSWYWRQIRVVGKTSKILVYNPTADRPLTLGLNASNFPMKETRDVKVSIGGKEVARLTVKPSREFASHTIGPLNLPVGFTEITMASDGETAPRRDHQAALENDWKPYSFRVAGLVVSDSGKVQPPTPQFAAFPKPETVIK